MKVPILKLVLVSTAFMFSSAALFAKDKPVELSDCPKPVQEVIKQYSAKATFEEIKLDKNTKTGGTPTYEAMFSLADGKRFEVHINAAGGVVSVENKKARE
jgi:hypothetical protein